MFNLSQRIRFLILLIYWIGGLIVTHVPIQSTGAPAISNLDKVAHFLLYLFLAMLMAYWLNANRKLAECVRLTLVICLIYAIADEGLQLYIPSRNASAADWLADCLGTIAGTCLYAVILYPMMANRKKKT